MTALPPHLETLETDLAVAAHRRVRQLRRRRRGVQVVAVLVALLVITGAGLAASGAGIFGWLASGEPGEARFSVDAGAAYDGPAPQLLACADASGEHFICASGSGAARVYELLQRAEAPQLLTRDLALARITALVRAGELEQGLARGIEADIRAVPDDFFEKLSILSSLSSVGVGTAVDRGSGARELVPPVGVPYFVECEQREAASFTCRPLAGASDVPVGAPIYALRPSSDWRERVVQPTPESAPDALALIDAVWGRPLERTEQRLLHLVSEPYATGSTSSGGGVATEQP